MKKYQETITVDRYETSDGVVWKTGEGAREHEMYLMMSSSDHYNFGELSLARGDDLIEFLNTHKDKIFEIMEWDK